MKENTTKPEQSDALEFAKWLQIDSYAISNPKAAIRGQSYNNNFYSFEELYEIFKKDRGIIDREKLRSL